MKAFKLLALLAALSLSATLTSCESTTDPDPQPKFVLISPSENIEGRSYGDWATEWWKQMDLTPASQNILFDETGSRVLNGIAAADNDVLLLAGVYNQIGTAVRTATIPAGKTLLMPVLNGQYDTVNVNPPMTAAERAAFLDGMLDNAQDMKVTIDGSVIASDKFARTTGDSFSYTTIADNISGYPAGMAVDGVVHDGYYLAVRSLSKGQHTIRIEGTLPDPINFHLDVTYNLTVE